ncbi:MAG: helix-turn-helix transcriptional regulator [Treponema sp.]|jgi:predicted transcriptional regulator YheO|nr:helix-turn-helix transcriptional regulator [Treponema sp.]
MKGLVEFLGAACGENCEVVLQDLREGTMGVAAIVNGHISGRKLGAPPTNLALRLMAQEAWKTKDYISNYEGRTRDGRILHSSTYFIKDKRDKNKLLGMLCVNIDTSKYEELSKAALRLAGLGPLNKIEGQAEPPEPENFYASMDEIIKSVLQEMGIDELAKTKLTQEDRLRIIERLMEHGIFLLRGSVSSVAEKLRCSEASAYRYIAMVNKKKARAAPEQ